MSGYQEVLREARERWMEGDAAALADFERGIGLALEEGDIPVPHGDPHKAARPADVGVNIGSGDFRNFPAIFVNDALDQHERPVLPDFIRT